MTPLAYRVSQCRICRKYLTFPIQTKQEWIHWALTDYAHCGTATEFIEFRTAQEQEVLHNQPGAMENVCCEGGA